ncbi:twin-arginine translocase subunit TatC [Halorarum halobium]|uniref:twin-arginine translocase subunit TatC n=1 Tax=Halorarum halobium TaxID=3075121 RepID=UPI0028ABE441|nr:twin-arginine translocase subunit TatC [Halobaculum sp. XH14]
MMTEDADGSPESTPSDGADESASDDEEQVSDGASDGSEAPDTDSGENRDSTNDSGSGTTDVEDADETATDTSEDDEPEATDSAADPDLDGDGTLEKVDRPDDPADAVADDLDVGPEEPESTPDAGRDGEGSAEPVDADAAEAEKEEELTTAQKGMQTVENVGNALGGSVEGPDSDQEMPLTQHIEEMMRRLAAVFAVAAVVSGAVLFVGSVSPVVPSAAELIRYFWDYHVGLPTTPGGEGGYSPYVYGPLEYLLTKIKVVGLAGLLAGLPMFVYQTYRFMRPGLYPHERRYYLAAVPTSLVLGVVGAAFAHFAVLPFVFDYFISYTVGTAELAFGLKETFNLILIMMGYFAVVFQIPLFIQLAIMMGVVTRQWLEDRRLIFWGGFLGLALTFISVDPTGFAPIIVAVTMITLFEGTLALLRWTGN